METKYMLFGSDTIHKKAQEDFFPIKGQLVTAVLLSVAPALFLIRKGRIL